jgi:predicted acylesterase/phospholipase RssA/CRP-like cAMP-binding protein
MFCIGVDLGQSRDYTIIAIVEKEDAGLINRPRVYNGQAPLPPSLFVRRLDRVALGTPYPRIVERIRAITHEPALAGRCALVIDATGLGAPVVDMLREPGTGCDITAVTITSGERESRRGLMHVCVPRRDLLAGVQLALEQGRLRILSDESLTAIMNIAELVECDAGEVVIAVESEVNYAYFLITGRMHVVLYDLLGKEMLKDTFVQGSVVGLFSLGLSARSHFHVEAIEPSTAIRLTLPNLLQLAAEHADFQLAMFRITANVAARYLMVDRSRPKPPVVAIVHHTDASRPLVRKLALRLRDLDESPCVAGDEERWKPDVDLPFKFLAEDRPLGEWREIVKAWAGNRRLLIDVRAHHPIEAMIGVLSYVDIMLWCVRPQDARDAMQLLEALEKESVPNWREKIRLVWLLDTGNPFPPYIPECHGFAGRDFKITFEASGPNQGSLLQHGFERIIHHLRGIQIGLALGGGAARGMAHLGVFKALEHHGIYVDMVAGTSAGAMTGTLYAAGLDPDYLIHVFKTSLQPPWIFQHLRGGGYWYLLYKYRRHQFESMLREHLGQLEIRQLIIPMFTISVDLIEGESLVREVGDATTDILESINLPPLALPILASGRALVDGGLLNNIPANVLVEKGCNFVIASSVTAKLEKDFAGIRSKGRSRGSRFFSTMQVIMREKMIQGYRMNAVGVQPADFVIEPDVTSFDISEFTRVDEMAPIGEKTTDDAIPKLRKMLAKLDPQLFASS